jgi:metal-sulfur cluster biosynthetic enzyme
VSDQERGLAMDEELRTRVLECLRSVIDPEVGVDVVRMRLVEDLEADDEGLVRYTFRPSSPLCPLAVTLALQIKQAVARVPGVTGQEISVEGYIGAESLSELLREA